MAPCYWKAREQRMQTLQLERKRGQRLRRSMWKHRMELNRRKNSIHHSTKPRLLWRRSR